MIHAKAVVIGDGVALAGSANPDERSLFLNDELMVSCYEPHGSNAGAKWLHPIARSRPGYGAGSRKGCCCGWLFSYE